VYCSGPLFFRTRRGKNAVLLPSPSREIQRLRPWYIMPPNILPVPPKGVAHQTRKLQKEYIARPTPMCLFSVSHPHAHEDSERLTTTKKAKKSRPRTPTEDSKRGKPTTRVAPKTWPITPKKKHRLVYVAWSKRDWLPKKPSLSGKPLLRTFNTETSRLKGPPPALHQPLLHAASTDLSLSRIKKIWAPPSGIVATCQILKTTTLKQTTTTTRYFSLCPAQPSPIVAPAPRNFYGLCRSASPER